MKNIAIHRCIALILALLVVCPPAFAQQEPPPASATQSIQDMGAEARAFEKASKIEPEDSAQRPVIEEPVIIEEGQEFPKKEVFVREIEVSGNTVFPEEEIRKIVSKYENQTILLTALTECAKQITALYRSKGYVTSQAYIPPQKIKEGKVRIEILEGRVGDIKVQGGRNFRDYGVKRLINLKKGQVFKVQKLEDSLVRVNRNPDITARAVLAPSIEKDSTDIVISVKDRFPLHVGHQYDNLGTKFSGRNRQNIIFTNNNLLTLNDRAIGRFVISERHDFIGESVSYSLPLTARGTTANFNFSNVNLKLGKSLKRFEIRGHSLTFGPSITFPILMTPHWEVDFNTGLDITSVKTKIGGAEDSNDQLRPIRFGPNISQFDKWGRTVFTSEFSQGFSDWLGASAKGDTNSSRADAGGQYFIWSTGLARFQRFFFDSILVLRANTQFTQFRLVSSEEYRLGGMETVRGYAEGDYLSDKGYNYTFEFRIPPYFIPKDFQILKQKPREVFQLVGFVDQGRGWVKDALPGELARKTLTGVGGGVLVDLFGHASARVYFAQAVGDDPSDGDQFRLHFILTSEF